MKFFETAMDLEKQTETYYLDLANKCAANEGLKNILNMLAGDHAQHFTKFLEMRDDSCSEMPATEAFHQTVVFFKQLKEKKESFKCDIEQVNMYKKANDLVQKKLDFYSDSVDKIECPQNKALVEEIIGEEKKHLLVLNNLIELLERPDSWVENAEFFHLDTY